MTDAAIIARLAEAGWTLPEPSKPAGAYAPFTLVGNLLTISGQVPVRAGKFVRGKVGDGVGWEEAKEAATLCALNILAQVRAACDGDLGRVRRCIKLGGFINAAPDFVDHPKVLDGASEVMLRAFGEAGRAARFAVGASSLPLGVAVEVDGTFDVV